ncbi:MAG: hypothetical protein ACRENP_25565 [Longimicrobiales bacterium]
MAAWQLLVVMSAYLALLSLISPFLRAFFDWGSRIGLPGLVGFLQVLLFEFGGLLLLAPYLYFALGMAYGTKRLPSALAALALTAWFMLCMLAYRFLLFWITFATG